MSTFDISIRSITGKKARVTVSPLHTVASIKNVLGREKNVDSSRIHFVYDKEDLDDTLLLGDLKIIAGSYLIYYIEPQKNGIFERQNSTASQKSINADVEKVVAEMKYTENQEEKEETKILDSEVDKKSVQFLQNMGFPRKQCKNALTFTNNNVSLAADLLCTGKVPDEIEYKEFNKKFGCVIKRLHQRGMDAESFIKIVSKFNYEDRKAIEKLVALGVSEEKAIEAYVSVDKNLSAATSLLLMMLE